MKVRSLLAFLPLLLGVLLFTSCDVEKEIDFCDLPAEARPPRPVLL